jgi:hypothetical protein
LREKPVAQVVFPRLRPLGNVRAEETGKNFAGVTVCQQGQKAKRQPAKGWRQEAFTGGILRALSRVFAFHAEKIFVN